MPIKNISLIICFLSILTSCTPSRKELGEALYNDKCSSCHLVPKIEHLPRSLWETAVLPDMGMRMGIQDTSYNPYHKRPFKEQYAMMQSGIYNVKPSLSRTEWELLREYILSSAPDSLELLLSDPPIRTIPNFTPKPVNIDSIEGSYISYLEFRPDTGDIIMSDIASNVFEYQPLTEKVERKLVLDGAITGYNESGDTSYITMVGLLDPSEIASGAIVLQRDQHLERIPVTLHRPVHTLVHDFDKNGEDEILVCEFGHLTGQLSLLHKGKNSKFEKQTLLNQPGTIRSVIRDMDNDGKDDIIALVSQGDESVNILYQTPNLNFKLERILRFSPLYGTSWFELLDYDNDGDEDIITVHGDNADNTQVLKPYHGIRIHINEGGGHFVEQAFVPLYGATRSVSKDFDQDGDIDIAVVSAFPDYDQRPEQSFVYLRNNGNFQFEAHILREESQGRWFLLTAGDTDNDGDDDIILSSFTYYFTTVPNDLSEQWRTSNTDIMILENELK